MEQTFLEYCRDFRGKRIFQEYYFNGSRKLIERPKSVLYWSGISHKDVFLNPKYIIEER